MRIVAVLDACVLVPAGLRDLLLSMADVGLFRPVWQEEIEDELRRNGARLLLAGGLDRGGAADALERVVTSMNGAFPDARITSLRWRRRMVECTNDPKDRHVVAAALASSASHLVTANLRHFPMRSRPPGLHVLAPDPFLLDLLARDSHGVVAGVEAMAARHRRPPHTPLELAELIAAGVHAPRFGRAVAARLRHT